MVTVEQHYMKQAKDTVNFLYDKRFLNDELSRESIDWLEEFIGFQLQSTAQMAARCEALTAKMRDRKITSD